MLEQEGYNIMGAAFEVYNNLGSGFLEEVYQRSLHIELTSRNIPYRSQQEITLKYKGIMLDKTYFADLVVYDHVIIELKAVSALLPEHAAQLMNYLKASNLFIGYLINFGHPNRLEWRRIALA
jgi:GxxExxY protein